MVSKPTSVKLLLSAPISPSEDESKVLRAARNILGDCEFTEETSRREVRLSSGNVECLQRLHDQLRDRRVRDAARRLMLGSRDGERITLMLNRQAAFVGTIVLCSSEEESPLGPIFLTIDSGEIDSLVEWLTGHQVPA